MIQAKELRLGNLYQKDGAVYAVTTINQIYFIGELVPNAINPAEDISIQQPIPLTEEWLLRFGARVYASDGGRGYRLGTRLFFIRGGFFVDYGSGTVLKYVHQLQNFYFALIGKELTLS